MGKLPRLARQLRLRARKLGRDQRGIEALEYLLIALLLAVAAYAAWLHLGRTLAEDVNTLTYASSSYTSNAKSKSGF